MDRWVLEGDSYSFFRSAPRAFNLQNRDVPNRVEIFDITAVPSHRNAISETTCLCDIFGDDCESPSLSSSPPSATCLKREADQPFPVDDANDSSGSYHTASGSDSGDNTEVTYTTPSPKNIKDFSTFETRESSSSPLESTVSENGLYPFHCTPPAHHVNSDELSHADSWEKPQVSANETERVNVSEPQEFNLTPDASLITLAKEPLEKRKPAFHEQGEIITAPEHTSTLLDDVVSSENPECMNSSLTDHCSQQDDFLSTKQMVNSGSPSELTMSTSPANEDINCIPVPSVTPELKVTSSSSPVSSEICSTPVSLGKSSPVLSNLVSTQAENTSNFPDLKDTCGTPGCCTRPSSNDMEIDSPTVPTTESKELVYSADARERSAEINGICSSTDVLAPVHTPEPIVTHSPVDYTTSPSPTSDRIICSTEPEASASPGTGHSEICSMSDHSGTTHSPEPVMIHSPQSYISNSSPLNEREMYSTEPEDVLSSPVITGIGNSDICSMSDHSATTHSPEPEAIHSPQSYLSNSSPLNERDVYSTEPEDVPFSPGISNSDICSSPDHSVPAHSPEPVIIHSPMDYNMSPSPTNERNVYLVERDDLSPSPAVSRTDYRVTPTYSIDSASELRSITSSPNSRQNYLTPDPTSPAPSLELRSVTCSPEIKTISHSVLPQDACPEIEGVANSVVSLTEAVCGNYSETSNSLLGDDASFLPTSENFLSTPRSISRASSLGSNQTRDVALSSDLQPALEPSSTLVQEENQPLHIICEQSPPSPSRLESRHFDDLAQTEIFKQTSSVNKCSGSAPQDLTQMLTSQDSRTQEVQIKTSQEIVSDDRTDLNMESVEIKEYNIEVCNNNETEMLKNDTAGSDKTFSQVPVALSESPVAICKDNGKEYDRQPCGEKEESGKREGEGVETREESSYREEQVDLSLSARNRKGPAGHSPAPSSRDPKSGIPARCYFESHPTTLQQQGQLRAEGSKQESKCGAGRVQTSVHGKISSAGFVSPECLGEASSMGSEFDEADNEVKWFTDLAFRSLSSPEVDYLDVYNSSHRSSTNVSHPSTNVDSPGAVAWMTYADLRGSTLHENDDLLHSSSLSSRDGLDPAKRFEMGSFECVDVALETKEESCRRKRTVPKRQIQLLRRNTDESKPKTNTENVLDSLPAHKNSKDTLVRQHSTPVFVQEKMSREDPASPQTDRKQTLQKSLSLDDAPPKTQMASSIIKSILSKKMHDAQKETSGIISPTGDKNRHPDISPSSEQSSIEKHSLNSSQHSEHIFSSKDFAGKGERSPHPPLKKCPPKVPPKPIFRPLFINTGEADFIREETRPIRVAHPFEDKALVKLNSKNDKQDERGGNLKEQYNRDSANARITSAALATQTVTMQSRMTNRDTERQMTQENRRQHDGSVFMSKTPEITLKPSTVKEKKKSSLKVSLSPDLERSKEFCEYQSMEKSAEDVDVEVPDMKEDDKTKSVIHKVRDVRKLVKNSYNLSFKGSNSTSAAEDAPIQEKRDRPPPTPPALHIECKAISWKDKQTSSKATHWQGETQAVDISKISRPGPAAETSRDTDITEITSKASLTTILPTDSQCTTFGGLNEPGKTAERSSGHCDQSSMQAMPPRPKSKDREVSALMVLQGGTSKTIQNTSSSTITDSNQTKDIISSHSVSMLLKEKGMQADIGVCDVITNGVSATAKHVNRLEVPLQASLSEAHASTAKLLPCSPTAFDNSSSMSVHSQDGLHFKPKDKSEIFKQTLAEESSVEQRKEQEKTKISASTTMTQISTNLTTSVKPEVRSVSSSIKNNTTTTTASKEIELPIQVRSISSDRLKPFVPPPKAFKQSFAEIKSMSCDVPKPDTQIASVIKQQTKSTIEPKKNELQQTLNEASSNNTKRLAVSAVSSCKPPPIPVTSTPNSVQKSATPTFTSVDQRQSSAFFQAPSSSQQMTTSFSQDHSILPSSFAYNTSIKPTGSQAYSHAQPVTRASNNRFNTEDHRFYATDDPPSYDERERFSPLRVSDLPPQSLCRLHSNTMQSACSCTQSSHLNQGHPHHNPQIRTPPVSQSPGQVLTCQGAPPQAQVRPHQCRPEGQGLNYLPVSTNTTAPHASALIQPMHHPRACPVPNTQPYGEDHPPTGPHMDRRMTNCHSPQAIGHAPYHEYANMSALDPRPQLFSPQELPPSFGHDYGNEGPGGANVLYPDNASGISCSQAPRRVLLDPDTGKYFYVEVPMQPLRKMLFDPELGQYVEVLIPQQAMSHSGLYQPAAPPYSSLHNPGLYAPQYLPYAVPSYPTIPSSAQQVRHPEAHPVPTTLHQTSLRYGSPASQMPKTEPKGHSSLDQSYLENMYYIPTGINASPNSAPSDCYHKPSSNLPPPGGRRV
ncbi:uncharacterized protein [Misgurnus anguillicaudatus]|uniref:uncharacterized protein n=1 Tax=Misgurnus anguillicaudatus TaxID=75329 RepID=UPI003CCF204D